MDDLDPTFLLDNPDLVRPLAPWCARRDNLELALLLLSLPWLAATGLRRAELERQLGALGPDMPVGPVYFQRVSRAVRGLESDGALGGTGRGRNRRFATTPAGFASLILNLRVLGGDPTVDASEFEFKRALVAMWNVVAERLIELPADTAAPEDAERFFGEVEAVALWGRPVITDAVVRDAFDVMGLVDRQRHRVRALRAAAAAGLEQADTRSRLLRETPLDRLGAMALDEVERARLLETVRSLAGQTIPALRARSTLVRYDAYLTYLDALSSLYARELKVVDFARFRAVVARRRA